MLDDYGVPLVELLSLINKGILIAKKHYGLSPRQRQQVINEELNNMYGDFIEPNILLEVTEFITNVLELMNIQIHHQNLK